jgi:hypothetical protein
MSAHRRQPFRSWIVRFPDLSLAVAATLLLVLGYPVLAQPTNSRGRPDFSAFKLITDRNIFDPRRSPHNPSRPARTESRRTFRPDYFTLVGIMSYEGQGPIAFFDGPSSQYQKVLKPTDTIAGYKITAIEPSAITLSVGTNRFELPIGMQLRRDSEGIWQLAEPADSGPERTERSSFARSTPSSSGSRPEPSPGPPGMPPGMPNEGPQSMAAMAESLLALVDAQNESAATNAPPEPPPGGGDTDPVLLRLMQRRAQEANQ